MTFGIKEIRERYGVGEHTVLGWIRNGELKAIDVSRSKGGRPKWRITQAALDQFESARGSAPAAPAPKRKRRTESTGSFY